MSKNRNKSVLQESKAEISLFNYVNSIEDRLKSDFKVSKSFGHSMNQGSIREHFIREFLNEHFSEKFAFGVGEIINAYSKCGEIRNQFDIVMYEKNYPKLRIGGITAFLAESVIATLEIKSSLTKKRLEQAIESSRKVKDLQMNFIEISQCGHTPPKILNYLLAYECRSSMSTLFKWIREIYQTKGIADIIDPLDSSKGSNAFTKIPSRLLDGIFILNKGFIIFGNVPIHLLDEETIEREGF
jgi:hypothetical protein